MARTDGLRARFYRDLRDGLERDGADSALLRYLRQEGRNKRLRELDAALAQGPSAYLSAIGRLFPPGKRPALSASLRRELARPGLTRADLAPLHERLAAQVLTADARTLLYDGRRKQDRTLALLEALYGPDPFSGEGGRPSPQSREVPLETWEALFAALRQEGRDKVFLPVRLDPLTGAGLYIVGRSWLPGPLSRPDPAAIPPARRGACYYICLGPDDLVADEGEEGEDALVLTLRADLDDLAGQCALPSLREALVWFSRRTAADARSDFLQSRNGLPPKGCPPELLDCFRPLRPKAPSPLPHALIAQGRAALSADRTGPSPRRPQK